MIAARKDHKVRVAPSRSPRASARRRGALEFTPHFAGLSHHQKSASRDQEVAPPARHAASEPPNTATHLLSRSCPKNAQPRRAVDRRGLETGRGPLVRRRTVRSGTRSPPQNRSEWKQDSHLH